MGMNGVNNGFLGFHDFRIPRENMLMKNSKVNFHTSAVRSAVSCGGCEFERKLMSVFHINRTVHKS